MTYERSELRVKNYVEKNSIFLKICPQEKPVLKVLKIVLISFRILNTAENMALRGVFVSDPLTYCI